MGRGLWPSLVPGSASSPCFTGQNAGDDGFWGLPPAVPGWFHASRALFDLPGRCLMTEAQARAAMKADLARSGLDPKKLPSWKLVGPAELAKLFPTYAVEWAYKIPYPRTFSAVKTQLCRYKILAWKPGPFGTMPEHSVNYLQPAKSPPGVYFPSGPLWEKMFGVESPHDLVIVEGEKKAEAGCASLIPTLGLGGVWNWSSQKQGLPLLLELEKIHWEGRSVHLCFDSDTVTNPQVARALAEFTAVLVARGALVHEATIPELPNCKKAGLDDFLVHHGAKGADALRAHLKDHAAVGSVCRKMFEFNAKYAVILKPTMILDETLADAYDRPIQTLHAADTWTSVVVADERVKVPVGDPKAAKQVEKPMSEIWMRSRARRVYNALTYEPGGPRVLNHGTRYNKWMGLGVEPKKGCVRPFLDLFDYFFPSVDDKAHKLWAVRWFGYPLKFLGRKMDTAVGFWSRPQGTGKSMVGDKIMGPIYGTNFVSIAQKTLDSDFNAWCAEKQFVMLDELSASDARDRSDHFKKMVTQPEVEINQKYIAAYRLPAHENYYMTSNSARAFYVSDEDRRMFVWEIKGSPLPKKFYDYCLETWVGWRNGHLPTGPGLPALLWYFQNELDYGDFDPTAAAPMTESKQAMAEINRHPAEHWLRTFYATLMRDPNAVHREVWTPTELAMRYKADNPSAPHISVNGFGLHISAAGLLRKKSHSGDDSRRLVAVTDFAKWEKTSPEAWIAEASRDQKF